MIETPPPRNRALWPLLAGLVAFLVFLSTLQTDVNGSGHPYAADVGEIQNALPRWGLIHRSSYPLYTATGSLFVTVLRPLGIEPAAGASLFSALWGAVTIGLLVVLAQDLGVPGWPAALSALAAAVSTSMWVDSSIAELHTFTLMLSVGTLIFALRFGRTGTRRDLLLLTLFFTQGVTHQRSVILLAPAVAVLSWPQLRAAWHSLGWVAVVALLGPLTYLYLPLRVWTGATWVFGSPGTWDGFWTLVLDNRAERVFMAPATIQGWWERAGLTAELLSDDLLWPLLVLGLIALVLPGLDGKRRESLGLALAWVPNLLLTAIIWESRISDALLAAKLPVVLLAGVGLGLILDRLGKRSRLLGGVAAAALAVACITWGWRVRPFVLSITRDPSAHAVIATAAQVAPPPDDRPTVLMALWGHDYWALTYAQEYRDQLPGLILADHNADFGAVVDRGDRLLTLGKTFYVLPVSWWEGRLGRLYLTSAAPGIVELSPTVPLEAADVPAEQDFDLGNGLRIRSARLCWAAADQLQLTIYWEVRLPPEGDYSVAVHLVARDPPQSGADIVAQADSLHPVAGWYPTSRWTAGEVIRDDYVLTVPPDSSAAAVRVAMYQIDQDGAFVNSEWLSIAVPDRPR